MLFLELDALICLLVPVIIEKSIYQRRATSVDFKKRKRKSICMIHSVLKVVY